MDSKNELQNSVYDELTSIEKKAPRYMGKEPNNEKCQSIWYNLLTPKGEYAATATIYLQELYETHRCDHLHDMISFRRGYLDYIGSKSYERILHGHPTEEDHLKAASSVFHSVIFLQRLQGGGIFPPWLEFFPPGKISFKCYTHGRSYH